MAKRYNDLVYGIRALGELITSGKPIDKIMVQKGPQAPTIKDMLSEAAHRGVYVQQVPREKLNRIVRGNHQGLIAFISPIEFQPLDEVVQRVFESGEAPFLLMLDGVTDVRNFGAIVRTANSVGVHAVIVPKKGSSAVNEDAVKTSAGALLHTPICKVDNLFNAQKQLQQTGVTLIGITEKTETSLFDLEYEGPICIIMGAEDTGLSNASLKNADLLGSLPMKGKVESLNVSVAAGVSLYQALIRRS